MKSRQEAVNLIRSWEGLKESNGSFKVILDIWNNFKGKKPRAVTMTKDMSWCACTWSAVAIKLGYTDIMPIEVSCGNLIEEAKKMGIWRESDSYIPSPGDALLYDWDDTGKGDNTGWPEHIGMVIETNKDAGYFVVMEGNYQNAVKKRTVSINGRYIRGFITPKYDVSNVSAVSILKELKPIETVAREVIAGTWGIGKDCDKTLKDYGYNVDAVNAEVKRILTKDVKTILRQSTITATCKASKLDKKKAGVYKTTASVYCRNDAGQNKKALCIIPKGTTVSCYGYYSVYNKENWLYIEFEIGKVKYTGFTSGVYLKLA